MYIVTTQILEPIIDNYNYLKLNRLERTLDVFIKSTEQCLREAYPLRSNFDASDYHFYELLLSIPCRFGGEGKSQTPQGIFRIQNVTKNEYVSTYRQGVPEVKLFGHLDIFEDYFIHSEMYTMDATIDTFRSMQSISSEDTHTAGCIRVAQDDLDWLIANIPVGTTIEM